MRIEPFAVEEWMNAWETGAKYNIAETCVDSVSIEELCEITGTDAAAFMKELAAKRLTYGDIEGSPAFCKGVCGLYRSLKPEHIVPTHGAAGANHHVFISLVSAGDRVVSVMPTYQQLYSIPESLGAEVGILRLRKEDGYLPDLAELKKLAAPGVKMICINNPNNPTGALMDRETLLKIAEIADGIGAWVLCDEVYRHLTHDCEWSESIADLYDKGISTGSMSKVFSLAGLRLGWIASRDAEAVRSFLSHRDYNLISCGMLDEAVAALALRGKDAVLSRNRGIVCGNLEILEKWAANEPNVDYVRPRAGTTALVHYRPDVPSYELCETMYKRTGAFVTPGDCFGEPKCFRIGYACDEETLKNGLRAVSEYFSSL